MLKTIIHTLAFLTVPFLCKAQFTGYLFEHKTNVPLLPLVNPIHMIKDSIWRGDSLGNEHEYILPVNPIVIANNDSLATINLMYHGSTIRLYDVLGRNSMDLSFGGVRIKEYSPTKPYQSEFNIGIDTSGPEQIVKFEYKKIGLANRNWQTIGFFNLQIWVYKFGDVEFRFGPSQFDTSCLRHYLNYFGLNNYVTGDSNGYYFMAITGNPDIPTLNRLTYWELAEIKKTLKGPLTNGFPEDGTVYRFFKPKVGLNQINNQSTANAWPSPFTNQLQVNVKNQTVAGVTLYTLNGVEVGQGQGNQITGLNHLPAGVYFVKATTTDGNIGYSKVVKY